MCNVYCNFFSVSLFMKHCNDYFASCIIVLVIPAGSSKNTYLASAPPMQTWGTSGHWASELCSMFCHSPCPKHNGVPSVYSLPRVALTRYHDLGGLTKREISFLTVLEVEAPGQRVSSLPRLWGRIRRSLSPATSGLFPVFVSRMPQLDLCLPLHGVLPPCTSLCPDSPFHKDTSRTVIAADLVAYSEAPEVRTWTSLFAGPPLGPDK